MPRGAFPPLLAGGEGGQHRGLDVARHGVQHLLRPRDVPLLQIDLGLGQKQDQIGRSQGDRPDVRVEARVPALQVAVGAHAGRVGAPALGEPPVQHLGRRVAVRNEGARQAGRTAVTGMAALNSALLAGLVMGVTSPLHDIAFAEPGMA